MPSAPLGPCTTPGCPRIREQGSTKCSIHRTEQSRTFNQRRDPAMTRLYASPAWRRLSRQVRAEEPTCRLCGMRPSTHADHIVAVHDGGASLARSNVQGVCQPCHDRKSGQERRSRARRSA